jgi:toxin FitB
LTILDTNVLSEVVKPRPDPQVMAWLAAQPVSDVYITILTVAEVLHGLEIMPEGKRRVELRGLMAAVFRNEFSGRILMFDEAAAAAYAGVAAAWPRQEKPGAFDLQIAAIARVYSASVATRNLKDFRLSGVRLVNPWGE